MVCSTPEIVAKEMDYLHMVLHMNNYPDWFLKKSNTQATSRSTHHQRNSKEVFISVPYIPGGSEEFRKILQDNKVQIIFQGCNTVKSLLMHPKEKVPPQLHQDVVYQWTCPEETCNSSYIGGSSRCLDNRVKEYNTSTTCTFTNTVPTTVITKQIFYNLKSLIKTASKFLEKPQRLYT